MPLRDGYHVIKRRDSRTELLVDAFEKEERIALFTFLAIRVQAEEHDVPDNSADLNTADTLVPEYA